MRAQGLTLLEVILAIGVLAIVLLAFTGLQITSLRASTQGRITQAMVREAQNLLENLRANPSSLPSQCNGTLNLPGNQEASCTYVPCTLSGEALNCGPSVTAPKAYRVTLRVPDQNPRLVLETVVYRP